MCDGQSGGGSRGGGGGGGGHSHCIPHSQQMTLIFPRVHLYSMQMLIEVFSVC